SFRADKPQTYTGVTIEVDKLGSIRGQVTRRGKPVEGSSVCCVQTATMQPEITTGADGRYEFRGVTAGTYTIGGGGDEIGAFSLGTKVTLARGEDKVVDFELDMAGAISGTVV